MKTHEVTLQTDEGNLRLCDGDEGQCKIAAIRLQAVIDDMPAETGRIRVSVPVTSIRKIVVHRKPA